MWGKKKKRPNSDLETMGQATSDKIKGKRRPEVVIRNNLEKDIDIKIRIKEHNCPEWVPLL